MLTVPEVAARVRRSEETIRRWIRSGRLPARKVGTQHVIDEKDLARLTLGVSPARRQSGAGEEAMTYEIEAARSPMPTELLGRIVADPKVVFGKPRIRGTRIAVELILDLMAHGRGVDEILDDYPHLVRDDVLACLAFAHSEIEGLRITIA